MIMCLCSRKIRLFIRSLLTNTNISIRGVFWYLGTFHPAAFGWQLFSSFAKDATVTVQICWGFIYCETQVCGHHRIGLVCLLKIDIFMAPSWHVHNFLLSLYTSTPLLSSPPPTSLKDEVVSQTGNLNILNITVPSSHLSLSHSHFPLFFL